MLKNKKHQKQKNKSRTFLRDATSQKANFLRWAFATLLVVVVYIFIFVGFYSFQHKTERLAGSTAALMIDFAPEPTAPPSQAEADAVQSEKVPEPGQDKQNDDAKSDIKKPKLKAAENDARPNDAPKKIEEEKPSELAAQKQRQKKQLEKEKVKDTPKPKTQEKEKNKKSVDKDKSDKRKYHKKAERGKRQKAAAPNSTAKAGKNYAAPRTSKNAGFNGQSQKVWADLVYRKIQRMARRMQRQLPGARGISYIAFSYDAEGGVKATRVVKSSGDDRLDALATRIVKASSPLPKPQKAGIKTIPIRVN